MGNALRRLFGMNQPDMTLEDNNPDETDEERLKRLKEAQERNPTNLKAGANFASEALRRRKKAMDMEDEE